MLHNAVGGGGGVEWGINFPGKRCKYGDVRFNIICITRGWVDVKFPEKTALQKT